jgi:hypothetical protein
MKRSAIVYNTFLYLLRQIIIGVGAAINTIRNRK